MARPSNDTLMKRLGQCSYRLGVLSTDEEWNITTRRAFPFELEDQAESARYVVLVRIHTTALASAVDKLNGSIRRAVNVRDAGVLIRARWNSHEVLFVLSTPPDEFCAKLQAVFRNEHVSVSIAHVPFSGNVQYDHDRALSVMFPVLVEEPIS